MATLIELYESGALETIDPLEPGELPWRTLYATTDFIGWLESGLPKIKPDILHDSLSPLEQVYSVFYEYVSGDEFSREWRFKKLNCTPDHHVWELKTDAVRVFGWVPKKNIFVCCFGDAKEEIMRNGSYGLYIARTAYVRNNLALDEPKCVESRRYEDVISDAD
ncbi:hypothetical protein [Pseudooceanicola sp. 200-1SW]|uniref:hypothetical protein n=1 Tax=Pseudooceanicola sp. 200-1SW TaxID=3425949 RepID=UPI003D7F5177